MQFGVGDHVYLTLKGLKQELPSKKLADCNAGQFLIVEEGGHSFKLELLPGYDIHPVFTREKLRLANDRRRKALTGQHVDPPPPTKIGGEDEYNIEQMLDARLHYSKLQYKIQFEGDNPDST